MFNYMSMTRKYYQFSRYTYTHLSIQTHTHTHMKYRFVIKSIFSRKYSVNFLSSISFEKNRWNLKQFRSYLSTINNLVHYNNTQNKPRFIANGIINYTLHSNESKEMSLLSLAVVSNNIKVIINKYYSMWVSQPLHYRLSIIIIAHLF